MFIFLFDKKSIKDPFICKGTHLLYRILIEKNNTGNYDFYRS
jgi:hypothetical protein